LSGKPFDGAFFLLGALRGTAGMQSIADKRSCSEWSEYISPDADNTITHLFDKHNMMLFSQAGRGLPSASIREERIDEVAREGRHQRVTLDRQARLGSWPSGSRTPGTPPLAREPGW